MSETITAPATPPPAIPAPAGPTQASLMSGASEPAGAAGDSMADAFGKLDARGSDLATLSQERPPVAKPKLPTRAKEVPAEKPPEKTPEKPAEAAKPEEAAKPFEVKPAEAPKPGETAKPKPASGWQKFHEAEKQIKELTTKLAEKEKASTMPEDHPELVRMRSEIEKREKRLSEVENHLRYKDYEASTEYQEQYHKPYMQTATEATQRATQLKIANAADGTSRTLTPEEFWQIVHKEDANSAIEAAEALFGEGSAKVNFLIERRNEILLAHQKAEVAKSTFKKDAAEITRKKQEEFQRQGTERSTLFKKLMTDGIEKDPALYKPEEGDAEGNKLLEDGFRSVDRVFSGGPPEVDGGTPMSPQEMIAAHADIRNKAAAFDRVAHKYKALTARVQELETALSEYETSAPAKGEAAGEKGPQRDDDMESLLGGLDKLGR